MTTTTEPTPREILAEFDDLVIEAMIAWLTKEQAEERVTTYQKDKYWNSSSENKYTTWLLERN